LAFFSPRLCYRINLAACSSGAALDTATIETITGLKGVSNQAEGIFKISKPRNDVAITVEQVRMASFMGLTSWATFTPGMNDRVMVMGDLKRGVCSP
jgi:hypothetical protein